jgi:hypothetical protein
MYEVSEHGFCSVALTSDMLDRLSLIGIPALLVYIYICARVNAERAWEDDIMQSDPGIRDIAKNTKLGYNQVILAIDKLEALNYISVSRNFHERNQYTIMPGIKNNIDFHKALNKWVGDQENKSIKRQKSKELREKSPFTIPSKKQKEGVTAQ